MGSDQKRSFQFSKPAIYQIEVTGRIPATASQRLEGMQITESQTEDGGAKTILVGRLSDQAALSGILNALYELHTSVISVTALGSRN